MGNYITLEQVKGELKLQGESNDAIITGIIEDAEEAIELFCDRQFYATTATRYFRGAGSKLFIDDLLSVTTFKLDEDGDGTFESTLAATDYVLFPLNKDPKRWVEISDDSDYGGFAAGRKKGVQIVGSWGYSSTTPKPIKRATLMQVCRWYERRKSGYATIVGAPEMGSEMKIFHGLDKDVAWMLRALVRRRL